MLLSVWKGKNEQISNKGDNSIIHFSTPIKIMQFFILSHFCNFIFPQVLEYEFYEEEGPGGERDDGVGREID